MNKKKQAIIITLLFTAVLVLVAMNSTLFSLKFDITETKVFTITEASKNIMRQLPEEMRITYFLTEKLKTSSIVFRQIEDILKQYAASSDGKVKLTMIDPSVNPEMEELARKSNIMITNQGTNESRSSANVFMAASGLLIEYQDQKLPVPVIDTIETLEYDLTAFIQSIVRNKTKKIGYIINKENWDNNKFGEQLQNYFEPVISSEMITPGMPIPDSIDALFVAGTPDFVESQLYEIDQYIMRGGKVLFSIDAVQQIDPPGPFKYAPLLKMIEGYGAKILPGYVMETEEAYVTIENQQGSFIYPYFFWAFGPNASKTNPISANYSQTIFKWTSPIELVPPLGVEAEKLNSSTDRAVKVLDKIEIRAEGLKNLYSSLEGEAEQTILIAALKGSFPSYFQGKEIPEIKNTDGADIIYNSIPSRILVIGNSNFIDPNFFSILGYGGEQYYNINFSYFKTCMEWLTNSEDLVAIKTRSNRDTSLGKIQNDADFEAWKGFATYFNLIFIPLLVVLFGIIKYLLRKKAKDKK